MDVAFLDADVPEIFAHRLARIDHLSGDMVRLHLVAEEIGGDGVRYVLAGRVLMPRCGLIIGRPIVHHAIAQDRPTLTMMSGLAAH